jgi:1-deoxy-D-xylulose-5-phosphate synthase
VHKLLTGRAGRFNTIRSYGGLSGFPKPGESEHDSYGTGHSSTSISAACGLAAAKALRGEPGSVIAVIGDGALTGGLAYEGMNNAGRTKNRLIVVLNDNKMSISKNVGAIARHLAKIRAKPSYFKMKDAVEQVLLKTPYVGAHIRKAIIDSKSAIKNKLYHSTIFEELGFVYLGPVDGHNIEEMCQVLRRAKEINKPAFVHVMTVKGKGYTYAEQNPNEFHGVSQFDISTGDPVNCSGKLTYSQIFGAKLCELAQADSRICAVTAAMTSGTGLKDFRIKYRERFFDVGIAEEHAVVFCCGLAKNGMLPVFAVYSSFLQRAYDQIIHDAAIQKLKIVLAIDHAGIVGEDGETHQGVFDAAYLNSIPGMTVYSPCTSDELRADLEKALHECEGPAAVRYPRGCEPPIPADYRPSSANYQIYGDESAETLIVTYGRLFSFAATAANELKSEGISAAVLKLDRIRPIDEECISCAAAKKNVLFFEEGITIGGIGEHFGAMLSRGGFGGVYRNFGIGDSFIPQGKVAQLLHDCGLDAQGIAAAVRRLLESHQTNGDN